jgi:hypothetical protein
MNLETAVQAKQARDVIRNEIVKALKQGDIDTVCALLKADEAATVNLAQCMEVQ